MGEMVASGTFLPSEAYNFSALLDSEKVADYSMMNIEENFEEDICFANFTEEERLQRHYYSISVPVLLAMGSAAFFLNGYILMSISWLRRPVSTNLCLSLSLAAVDAWTSALTVTVFVVNSYLPKVHCVNLHYCLRLTVVMIQMGGLMSSVLHVFFLALNHYCGIVYPILHKRYSTGRVKKCVLYSLWVVPPFLFIVFCFLVPGQAFMSKSCMRVDFLRHVYYHSIVFTVIFLPMVLTFGLYFRIVFLLTRQRSRDPIIVQNQQPMKQNRKLFVTMLLITMSFLLGWLPSCSMFLLVCPNGCPISGPQNLEQLRIFSVIYILVNACIVLKLFINPLIYATRILELRYAIWRMHTNRWSLSNRRTQNVKLPKEFEPFVMNRTTMKTTTTTKNEKKLKEDVAQSKSKALKKLITNDEIVLMEEITPPFKCSIHSNCT